MTLKINPAVWQDGAVATEPAAPAAAPAPKHPWQEQLDAVAAMEAELAASRSASAPAPNPIAPQADERDAIIEQMRAALAAVEARAAALEAERDQARRAAMPARVEPAPFPGELHRERVDDTLLVFVAETYKDMRMVACYQVNDEGRRHSKPLYTKSRDKALDPVYRAAVAGVHRLHEEAENE